MIDSMAKLRDLLIFADHSTVTTRDSGVVDEVNSDALYILHVAIVNS